MERHHRSAHGDRLIEHRAEDGSALIEGVAALAFAFLLLAVLAQAGFALAARSAADAATASIARRAALPGADAGTAATDLAGLIASTVPGARRIETHAGIEQDRVIVRASFDWDPPGPRWMPLRLTVQRSAPLVVEP